LPRLQSPGSNLIAGRSAAPFIRALVALSNKDMVYLTVQPWSINKQHDARKAVCVCTWHLFTTSSLILLVLKREVRRYRVQCNFLTATMGSLNRIVTIQLVIADVSSSMCIDLMIFPGSGRRSTTAGTASVFIAGGLAAASLHTKLKDQHLIHYMRKLNMHLHFSTSFQPLFKMKRMYSD
jgi:hypothetical protein